MASHLPWAQGVAGSNPVAPTTSSRNLHNTKRERELAASPCTRDLPRVAAGRPFSHQSGHKSGPDPGIPRSVGAAIESKAGIESGACPRTAHTSHPTAQSPRGGDPGVLGEKHLSRVTPPRPSGHSFAATRSAFDSFTRDAIPLVRSVRLPCPAEAAKWRRRKPDELEGGLYVRLRSLLA